MNTPVVREQLQKIGCQARASARSRFGQVNSSSQLAPVSVPGLFFPATASARGSQVVQQRVLRVDRPMSQLSLVRSADFRAGTVQVSPIRCASPNRRIVRFGPAWTTLCADRRISVAMNVISSLEQSDRALARGRQWGAGRRGRGEAVLGQRCQVTQGSADVAADCRTAPSATCSISDCASSSKRAINGRVAPSSMLLMRACALVSPPD